MTATTRHRLAALALAAPLLLGACSSGDEDQALPDVDTSQEQPDDLSNTPSVVGYMVSTTQEELLLRMPDGTDRTFQIRAEDAPQLGIDHLSSHAGLTDIGFQVFYETEGDTDYVVAAYETASPQ